MSARPATSIALRRLRAVCGVSAGLFFANPATGGKTLGQAPTDLPPAELVALKIMPELTRFLAW